MNLNSFYQMKESQTCLGKKWDLLGDGTKKYLGMIVCSTFESGS